MKRADDHAGAFQEAPFHLIEEKRRIPKGRPVRLLPIPLHDRWAALLSIIRILFISGELRITRI